ncbi:sodium/glucose cotransporter 2, partial [Plakobranchus ocellatus]
MVEQLTGPDFITIGVYFAIVLTVGMWSTFRPNRDSTTGYFLAGRTMHWFPVGASIFASNVGAPMFIGLSGTAAASGIACAIYEWHAIFLLIALGWVFVPVYIASGCYTMPEYLKKRFGGVRLRIYLSVVTLILYVLTRISAEIYSGALFMQRLLGWNLFACVGIILAVTAVYTVLGGLAAVIYTDTVQTVILLIGSCMLFITSMIDIGGWSEFVAKYERAASNQTLMDPVKYACGLPRNDSFHIWRDPVNSDLPWTGTVFGLTMLGIWVWCTDQLIVQRCLASKNMTHSKAGTVFAAALKITTFFLFIIPGMISRIFFPDEIACSDPVTCEKVCGNEAGCYNIAYPLLVLRKLPQGFRGLLLAALLAALMSSLTSIFNSAGTMLTLDLWNRFRRQASQAELMVVGRVSVLILIAL